MWELKGIIWLPLLTLGPKVKILPFKKKIPVPLYMEWIKDALQRPQNPLSKCWLRSHVQTTAQIRTSALLPLRRDGPAYISAPLLAVNYQT